MKATELMISDWVYLSFDLLEDTCKPFPARINMDYLVNTYYGKFVATPIPLTEEILKANGFVRCTHWSHASVYRIIDTNDRTYQIEYTRYTNSENILGKSLLVIETYSVKGINKVHILDCISVHELQHALRLCGLHELADNFKIK